MRKIYKFMLGIFSIMIILSNYLTIYSLATQEGIIEYKGDCGKLIKKNGTTITISYVVYNNNGKESPVYCLDKNKPGAEKVENYKVNINKVLKDTKIWKAIKNGYPYKTPSELECANEKEAFAATKMAVYAVIYGYTIEDYEPIGEAGQRTYNAIKNILENVENSTNIPKSSNVNIIEVTENWLQDETNLNKVYKIFKVEAESDINEYKIYIENEDNENILITDINNQEKNTFLGEENFKISIPIKELKENGNIRLKVLAELKSNPIYIGESLNPNCQDYAITQIETEEGIGEKQIYYTSNKTKIKIIKKDNQNNNLQNAVFEILDENKNTILTNLVTDTNGEINVGNLIPGRYYIKEVIAPAGYENYDKNIEVNVKFNEELSVVVRNSKEEEPIVEVERNLIEINQIEETIKLPKTGM